MLSFSSFGQHLLFLVSALLQPWYCFTRIWRPCVFVPSMDNVVSVMNHHVLFVLILFPCAWGHPFCKLQITYRAVNIYLLDLQEKHWLQLQISHHYSMSGDLIMNCFLCKLLLLWIHFVHRNRMFRNKYRASVSFRQFWKVYFHMFIDWPFILVGLFWFVFFLSFNVWRFLFAYVSNITMDLRPCMRLTMLLSHANFLKNKVLVYILDA